jgi:hypothetical protein
MFNSLKKEFRRCKSCGQNKGCISLHLHSLAGNQASLRGDKSNISIRVFDNSFSAISFVSEKAAAANPKPRTDSPIVMEEEKQQRSDTNINQVF